MFKDLKEYQDITKIYQDSVNITEEEREIIKIFKEENFTDEELIYVIENFDELYDSEIDLTESLLNEEELQEIKTLIKKGLQKVSQSPVVKKALGGVKKKVTTGAGGLKQRMSAAYDKNIAKGGVQKLKSSLSGIKKTVVSKLEKAKPIIKKGLDTVKKFAPVGVAGAAGFVAGKMSGGDKKPSNTDASGKVIPSTAQIRADAAAKRGGAAAIGGGNAGASTDSGGTSQSTIKSVEPKPKTTETKPKKMHPIEKKNRARLGDARVDALKAKNADFKLMRKGQMSKDDFIKKYPKSITAQRSKGLRDHTEWDAYDMVLEYLFSTEQVTSLEEANYVMMEMEQQTIGEIVKEVKVALIDEGVTQPIITKKPGYKEPKVLTPFIKPTMPLIKDKRTGEYMTTDGKPFDLQKFKDDYNKKKPGGKVQEGLIKKALITTALATPFLAKKFLKPKTDKMLDTQRKTNKIGGDKRSGNTDFQKGVNAIKDAKKSGGLMNKSTKDALKMLDNY